MAWASVVVPYSSLQTQSMCIYKCKIDFVNYKFAIYESMYYICKMKIHKYNFIN